MALIEYFAAVPPNGYAVVPSANAKERILYTTSLASCLGLVILRKDKLAALAHVVSADSVKNAGYFAPLLEDIDGPKGVEVLVAMGAMAKASSKDALGKIQEAFELKALPKLTQGASETLLFNTLTGFVLNQDVDGAPEAKALTKDLRTLILKGSKKGYESKVLFNTGGKVGGKVEVASALTDKTIVKAKPVSFDEFGTSKKGKSFPDMF